MASQSESPRAAIYVRVSTDRQADEGLSIETQIQNCTLYAQAQGLQPPFCIYMDAGISGGSIDKRPAMLLLLADVEERRVQRVIVSKLDRAWRSVKDAAESLERIKKSGGALALLDLQVDTSSPAGEMMFNLLSAFAQFERKRIGQRVHEVNTRIVLGGRHVGGHKPPFGYSRDESKNLVIKEEEACLIRRIFEDFTRDQSSGANTIARQLNREGVPAPGGGQWSSNKAFRLLRNPVYVGEVKYGRNGPRGQQWLSDDGRTVASGSHVALISREVWQNAQDKMRSRRTPGRSTSPSRVYGGLIYCQYCRSRFYSGYGSEKGQPLYTCARVFQGTRADCTESKRIMAHILDALVTAAVIENIKNANAAGWTPATRPNRRSEARDRSWFEEKLTRLQEVYIDGGLSREEYQRRRSEIESELARLDRTETQESPLPSPSILADFASYIQNETLDIADRRAIAENLIERILVGAETITVHFCQLRLRGWKSEIVCRRPLPWELPKSPYKKRESK